VDASQDCTASKRASWAHSTLQCAPPGACVRLHQAPPHMHTWLAQVPASLPTLLPFGSKGRGLPQG
jgi:hypothetical protein